MNFSSANLEATYNRLAELTQGAIATGQKLVETTTENTGKTLDAIAEFPLTRFFTQTLKADWLGVALGRVNTKNIQATVTDIQRKYPNATPDDLAHRLIVQKAINAGGVGLMTNLIPPMAIALLGIEIATITKMQVEMVYEIAAVYGLNLDDPSRRGEALAIFGIALGSNGAIKTGLSFAEIIPGIGAIIGASSNAALFYGLGFVASRYYENKQSNPQKNVDLEAVRQASAVDLASTLAQRSIVDKILVHVIRVSYPDGDWSAILPKLRTCTNLSPSSLATISEHLDNPTPLVALYDALDASFAPSLVAQAYRITRANGEVSVAESALLNDMANRFNLDLVAIQTTVDESMPLPQCAP
ncbi:MAG: hypothetical protein SAJ12_22535 [Jaaginema sp. PMC 1079.18]|nr:hypothetical protein [Jaaginema sp. PMC 1080.18]MEC4853767.1 hypothetical protein [Jaaginema sp. PMC 1079.18]MEC4864612.1 hypothetical protein [Jaaginema sp. PMC 1078.18]